MLGDLDKADDIIRKRFDHLFSVGEKSRMSSLAAGLAWIEARRDSRTEAKRLIVIADEAATQNDADTRGQMEIARAILALNTGDNKEAIDLASHAIELFADRRIWPAAAFYLVRAEARDALGEIEAAIADVETALKIYEAKNFWEAAEQTPQRLDQLA